MADAPEATPSAVDAPPSAPTATPGPQISSGPSVDPVQLLQQYQAEALLATEGLRQRGQKIQETVQEQIASSSTLVESLKNTVQQAVEDKSDVQTPPAVVVSTFLYSAVLTFAASLAFFVGANILGGAVQLFVGGFAIALSVLVVVPVYAYYAVKGQQEANATDFEIRAFLLAVALGSGVLLGAGFNTTYFYSEPLAFLSPLTVSLAFAYGSPALGNNRQTLLGASVGGGLGLHLVLGLFTGSLSISYLLLSILYAASAYGLLVALFQNVKSEAPTHLYMLGYITAYFLIKASAFGLLGSSTPYAVEEAPKK